MPSTVQGAGNMEMDIVKPLFLTFWSADTSRIFVMRSGNRQARACIGRQSGEEDFGYQLRVYLCFIGGWLIYNTGMVFARHQQKSAPALLNPCSHLPPHPIPLGCPRAQALDSLHHTSNFHRLSVLHMVMHMFQLLFSPIIPPSPSPTESKSLFSKWKVKVSLSRVRLFETPWTTQSMEFSRLEYWSG